MGTTTRDLQEVLATAIERDLVWTEEKMRDL